MKPFLVIFVLILLASNAALAQQVTSIDYGDEVVDEITNRQYEFYYSFNGEEDDIIIIEMTEVDILGDLTSPLIILLDADDDVVADTSQSFTLGDTLLIYELRDTGKYTIIATRENGRAGDSVGEFQLRLHRPQIMELGAVIEDSVTNEDGTNYYTIINDGSELLVAYQKEGGRFAPEISVNRISDRDDLQEVITVTGEELTHAVINIPDDRDIFIISVGAALFDFQFNEVTADYTLELREP